MTDERAFEEAPCVKCGEQKVIRVAGVLRCLHCGHDELRAAASTPRTEGDAPTV